MINVQNLGISLDSKPILKDLSFTIKPGKMTGIIGPNGAGKTTLLKALTGLIKPNSGFIEIDNKKLADYSLNDLAKKRAYLSQNPKSVWSLSVFDIINLGRLPHKQHNPDLINDILEKLELNKFKDRPIETLSTGEQARAHLGRALATEAPTLFIDEPTSAFDILHQHSTLSLLKELNKTCVVILHDLIAVQDFCDDILCLSGGELVGSGPIDDPSASDWITSCFGQLPSGYWK